MQIIVDSVTRKKKQLLAISLLMFLVNVSIRSKHKIIIKYYRNIKIFSILPRTYNNHNVITYYRNIIRLDGGLSIIARIV